jgi:chorismate mutase/prephenate dehydrogenase
VGEFKDRDALALRDFTQEKVVLDRARLAAEGLGLAPDLAESLMRLLIESSLTVQEQQRVEARAEGGGRRALVIGGAGRMGDWFARFLASQGFGIEIADPASPGTFLHRPSEPGDLTHDVIVVGDARETAVILRDLTRAPHGLIFDTAPFLREPLQARERGPKVRHSTDVRPDTRLLGQAWCQDLGREAATRRPRTVSGTMASVVPMVWSHDRVIPTYWGSPIVLPSSPLCRERRGAMNRSICRFT